MYLDSRGDYRDGMRIRKYIAIVFAVTMVGDTNMANRFHFANVGESKHHIMTKTDYFSDSLRIVIILESVEHPL